VIRKVDEAIEFAKSFTGEREVCRSSRLVVIDLIAHKENSCTKRDSAKLLEPVLRYFDRYSHTSRASLDLRYDAGGMPNADFSTLRLHTIQSSQSRTPHMSEVCMGPTIVNWLTKYDLGRSA